MLRFLVQRILLLIPTLVLASVLVFAIIELAPGDPARMMLGTDATPAEVAAERVRLGLDRPIPVRYVIWLTDVAHLNLGVSLVYDRPVTALVLEAFPNTLRLAVSALILSILIGFPLGVLSALRQNHLIDFFVTSFASLGLAVPAFWLGIMLILLFSVTLKWLPPSGAGDPGQGIITGLRFLVMPVITIALSNLAVFSRFVRSSMIDVLTADFVRTARAKGLADSVVVYRHALRNALIPVVTILGIQVGRLLGGAVITEAVFAYPGIGRLVVTSILNRDYPVVQGTLMLVVVIFLVTNILVDVSYAFLDPRVSLGGASK